MSLSTDQPLTNQIVLCWAYDRVRVIMYCSAVRSMKNERRSHREPLLFCTIKIRRIWLYLLWQYRRRERSKKIVLDCNKFTEYIEK